MSVISGAKSWLLALLLTFSAFSASAADPSLYGQYSGTFKDTDSYIMKAGTTDLTWINGTTGTMAFSIGNSNGHFFDTITATAPYVFSTDLLLTGSTGGVTTYLTSSATTTGSINCNLTVKVVASSPLSGTFVCVGMDDDGNQVGRQGTWTASKQAAPQITPQSGWWWNAAEPGRGYFIEVKNGKHFTASYLYDNSGYPLWYVTGPATVSGSTLPGTLGAYSGGQTLSGAYKSPTGPTSAGNMNITFSDTTHGTITWPGGSVPITRYELATGSLSAAAPSFQPETGWWWNASEGGRGFSIEVQGDNLFIGGFMYDGSGNPVWYVSAGKMSTPRVYQGNWMQYGNGQSMGGVFKAAAVKNNNVGGIAISFTSTTTATMYLPDGRTIPLTRYSF